MVDAVQVQRRRGTAAQCDGMTPADGEIIVDSTNDRLRLGDGIIAGGVHIPNYLDNRNHTYETGTVGGTGDAITLALAPAATAYATGMTLRFLATATNTGAATINVNGLGTKAIKKIFQGAIADVVAGDILNGAYYEMVYNGTAFQIMGESAVGLISQGDLSTSTGTGGTTINGSTINGVSVTGVYGNWTIGGITVSPTAPSYVARIRLILTRLTSGVPDDYWAQTESALTLPGGEYGFFPTTNVVRVGTASTFNYTQRYITASPPYDMGDGEVGGFMFLLLNSAGDIVCHYFADTPPWAYNGPTDIRATHKCKVSGKKFRQGMRKRSFEEMMDGAPLKFDLQEITHKIKNADMALIPHPFGEIPPGHRVVMLDPMDQRIRTMAEYQNAGGRDITEQIAQGKFHIDNEFMKRKGPPGVDIVRVKYKYTRKF